MTVRRSLGNGRFLIVICLLALVSACATEFRETSTGPVEDAQVQHVLAIQNPALTPENGGRLVDASLLEPGDIILSAAKGITSLGVRLFTTSPVSHAALYMGQGEIVEAVGEGVRRRSLHEALEEDAVAVAFRFPELQLDQMQRISEFADAQIGKKYNHLGVVLQAPFALEKKICELPVLPATVRDLCIRGVASIQLGVVSEKTFFCSQFLIEAYRNAGIPMTDADPRWISPADIMHMREGDVPSMRARQTLAYVGHLKFRAPLAPDNDNP
jgi:uncharacterized protein YycO